MHDATFAHGRLYLTSTRPATGAVVVWEVPITEADVQHQIEINPQRVSTWELSTPGQNADATFTTVDITDRRDVVVGWRSFTTATTPSLAKYAVLYHGHTAFTPSQNVFNLVGTQGTAGQVDFVSSVRDTYDPGAVWTALCDERGFVLSFIAP